MSIKVLVAIIVMSIIGYFLLFFATPDNAPLLASNTSLFYRLIKGLGLVLILPTVPFTLLVDPVFLTLGGAYSPGYSVLIGIVISSVFWATVVRQTRRWVAAHRSNQSPERTGGRLVE